MMYLGIDLGGTHMAAGIVDENNRLIEKVEEPTGLPRSPEDLAHGIYDMAASLARKNGLALDSFPYVGIGIPGTVNMEDGTVEYANNFNFNNVPFIHMLDGLFPVPVYGANDADTAALAEYLAGAGKGAGSMFMVTLGTGIGGSMILGGKLWTGFNNAAGEIGHMVIDMNGRECNCGRRGCFERYASATALVEDARRQLPQYPDSVLASDTLNGRRIFEAAAAGDPLGQKLVEDYITYLATGVTNLINIFQPERLVIGGGISYAGDALLAPLREKVAPQIYSRYSRRNTEILLAQVGNDAGIIGAARLECVRVPVPLTHFAKF